MRVMFYVQHLLGIGHIKRAALLCAAMKSRGLEVSVVVGGRDVPGIDFADATLIRLPMAHVADHTFNPLLNENNEPVDEHWKTARKDKLLSAFRDIRPDVIVLEMYPFGRRQFRFELEPLLVAAHGTHPRPLIMSSIRDILVNKAKPGRSLEIADLVRNYFDLVLVHADQALIKLDESFPETPAIADLIRYTGYVAPARTGIATTAGSGEVIVSAGGGAVGATLLNTALAAKENCALSRKTWRFITGPNMAEADLQRLQKQASENVIIERFRVDLPHMLGNCELSISQAGYNTIIDLLMDKTKAIVVPFADGGESEQLQRARLLEQRNILKVIKAGDLSVSTLIKAINQTVETKFDHLDALDLSGAETTAQIIAAAGKSHG